MKSLPRMGIMGAGLMGSGMAHRLLSAGHAVSVIAHRNRETVEALIFDGAEEVQSPAMLVHDTDALLTCLPDAECVEEVADAVCPELRPGYIWIDTTTSIPEISAALARRLSRKGAVFADAPVTGGPVEARAGELASLVGCHAEDYPAVAALIAPYSKVIRRFGAPGCGHAAKLLNNLVTQGTMALLADAYQCAICSGIDTRALFDVMMTGAACSGTLKKAVGPALEGYYDGARFSIEHAAKDLRYARDLVASIDPLRVNMASAAAEKLARHVNEGRGSRFVSEMLDPHFEETR